MLGHAKFLAKQALLVKQYILRFKEIKCFVSHSTQQNIIQHWYWSYCDYLSKMGCMDEEQAVFQQLTLSYFKKWSATALQVQLSRLRQFLPTESPLKIMKKCFLFDLKSSYRSQDN